MPSSITSSEPVRVLLVDDNQAILARVETVLSPACVVVGSATDGKTAVKAALSLEPDVVVLDISMPGMSGFEVAARLRTEGSSAAVVFLTVHDEEELISAAKQSGGMGYVVKPRIGSDLLTAVKEAHAGRPFTSPLG
jgi:DNA-binding NarL/FixJ family response regulator